jgi:hypothetical protein
MWGACTLITNLPYRRSDKRKEKEGLLWVLRIKCHKVKIISPRKQSLFFLQCNHRSGDLKLHDDERLCL